jgi:hypothetical protein
LIEYIDNAIKATAGENICLIAKVIDSLGNNLEACTFCLFDDNEKLFMVDGLFNGTVWEFYVPAEATAELKGRYWYAVCDETDTSLCFKNPIYFM